MARELTAVERAKIESAAAEHGSEERTGEVKILACEVPIMVKCSWRQQGVPTG